MTTNADEKPTDQPTPAPTITKVVISTPGISVAVESAEPLTTVQAHAQAIHREAHQRCGLPDGFGGAL